DLGCEYTLTVDERDVSLLRVTRGEVELAGSGRVSRVPAGYQCETRPHAGPGIPLADDAPSAFVTALSAWGVGSDEAALMSTMATARKDDAVSLWHLLDRTRGVAHQAVYDRLSKLVPPPTPLNMDTWWNRITE